MTKFLVTEEELTRPGLISFKKPLEPNARVLTRGQVEKLLMRVEQAQDYKDGPRITCNHLELLDELFGEESE